MVPSHVTEATLDYMLKIIDTALADLKQYQISLLEATDDFPNSLADSIITAKLKRLGLSYIKDLIIRDDNTRGMIVKAINMMELHDAKDIIIDVLKDVKKYTSTLPNFAADISIDDYMKLDCKDCPIINTCSDNQKSLVTRMRMMHKEFQRQGDIK